MIASRGFETVAIQYPYHQPKAIVIKQETVDTPDKIAFCRTFISENSIDQADIRCEDLGFLRDCPSLKYLRIRPVPNTDKVLDFSPLYDLPEIRSLSLVNESGSKVSTIDFLNLRGLQDLFVKVNMGTLNFNKVETLKSLRITGFKGADRNLTDMFCSEELDTLEILQCGITNLDGIDISKKMQCLYLSYNRGLADISALWNVKQTLRALRIVNCPKIKDFSVLRELENLELLELSGKNEIPDLSFIREIPTLQTLIFSVNVQDGNLAPCLDLSYVHCSKPHRHYNVLPSDLPKNRYYRGNENIEPWRRLE